MRWEDERYVRLYTRDTPEWSTLSFAARGLFCLILRVVDRAGVLPLGKLGGRGVAVAVRAAWVDVEGPLGELLADGCVQIGGAVLVVPNFLDAQETPASDIARKRKSREVARAEIVTLRDSKLSHNVTELGHDATPDTVSAPPDVTKCHSVPSVPVRSVPGPSVPSGPEEREASPRSLPAVPLELALRDPPAPTRTDIGKPGSKAQGKLVDRHSDKSLEVFAALDAARRRVNPNVRPLRPRYPSLEGIASRLEAGYTVEECLFVVATYEAEVKAGGPFGYFDAISPWRPENFERALAKDPKGQPDANTSDSRRNGSRPRGPDLVMNPASAARIAKELF